MRKGQAAMEFLMTYGWAIIIVLAAIGALAYFGVLSPQKLLPERTTFPAPLPNVDTAVISAAGASSTVSVAFKNNKGVSISSITDGTWSSTGSGACAAGNITLVANVTGGAIDTYATQISNGDGFTITWTCDAGTSGVGDRFNADISFTYTNVETGQVLTETGSVQGKYS
jgi:uncharacterized protein (UPF0333 family)